MNRLLVGVSGSAAVLSLPLYLATLRAVLAKEVRVIMTAAAASILPPSTVPLIPGGVFSETSPPIHSRAKLRRRSVASQIPHTREQPISEHAHSPKCRPRHF